MQKQKEEDERKIAERKQKDMKKKMKEIARQKSALTKDCGFSVKKVVFSSDHRKPRK